MPVFAGSSGHHGVRVSAHSGPDTQVGAQCAADCQTNFANLLIVINDNDGGAVGAATHHCYCSCLIP